MLEVYCSDLAAIYTSQVPSGLTPSMWYVYIEVVQCKIVESFLKAKYCLNLTHYISLLIVFVGEWEHILTLIQ